jgi:hypothetical protein
VGEDRSADGHQKGMTKTDLGLDSTGSIDNDSIAPVFRADDTTAQVMDRSRESFQQSHYLAKRPSYCANTSGKLVSMLMIDDIRSNTA